MLKYLLVLAAALLFLLSPAEARPIEVRHQRPIAVNCAAVREVVASVGEAEAERLARMVGATEARLVAAKRCLKS